MRGMWLRRLSQPGTLISRRVVGLRRSSLVSSWVSSSGPLGLALPLVRRRMQRELQRDIATIKATLEAPSKPFERSG
jgi:hypothetical protein